MATTVATRRPERERYNEMLCFIAAALSSQ
jgi:hypothetical protein